ncbi:MAG: DNA repair protein RecN [Rhodobacterales bacterium]
MLRGLVVKDMLIIDELELSFEPGLNVLTGETGAGKSILLDCLGFVLGWRGQAGLVRQGAEQGEVTAWFDIQPNHPVNNILIDSGIELDSELILRRINGRDGRKTAFVNGVRCSAQVLRRISETLLELHGQNDDRGLLNVRSHQGLLDDYAGANNLKIECSVAWNKMLLAEKVLAKTATEIKTLQVEEDYLRHTVAELLDLDVSKGDDDSLDARRRLMQSAEKIKEDVTKSIEAISGSGAETQISNALRWIESAAEKLDGQLAPAFETLQLALNAVGKAQQEIEVVVSNLNFDAVELEQTEERLFAIRAAARKHSVVPDELPRILEELTQKIDNLHSGNANLEQLEFDLMDKSEKYKGIISQLRKTRVSAAKNLDVAMSAELVPLKMERAIFRTEIVDQEGGPTGADKVSFKVATNPGSPTGPLEKIASGGELSRFLLALKVCLSKDSSDRTMIFDEIDRGVGGSTADAVGRRLASLGGLGQVLVVTHSPQVAALGIAHWRVEKSIRDKKTFSTVTKLGPEDRVNEIARMLAGEVITDEAREAARSLLKMKKRNA